MDGQGGSRTAISVHGPGASWCYTGIGPGGPCVMSDRAPSFERPTVRTAGFDLARWLPGLADLRDYRLAWLRHDVVAGVVLVTMLVPVGIAYAVASGLPGVFGLYATIVPLLAYALFGPSRVLVLGPDSSLAPLILAVVVAQAANDAAHAVALAAAMALVTVLISQLPKLLGFSIEGSGPLRSLWAIARAIADGAINWTAFAVGAAALALILLLKRSKLLPGVLIAVVAATVAVGLLDLGDRGVKVLGSLPQGLPGFALPWIGLDDLVPVLIGGAAIALVSFADTSVLSRAYAQRLNRPVDPNQEMIGLGAANLAAGLFQGFPISSSSSRTPVAEAAGARTQMTGVVGALGVALLLVAAPGLLKHLPTPALAAVVIASAIGLIEVDDLRRIWRIQRWEFWLSILCLLGVAVLGAVPGIGLAIVVAVIEFLWDGWRPHSAILGRPAGVRGWHDIGRYPDAQRLPGLVLFRWDAPLFFANAELFQARVLDAVDQSPGKVHRVVVAAEPVTSVDVTAADTLAELDATLAKQGIELCFAELKDPVKDKLRRFELYERFGDDRFFPTLNSAVDAYCAQHRMEVPS